MKAEAARYDEELAALGKRSEILDASTIPKCIVSDKYRKWHVCLYYVYVPVKDMKRVVAGDMGRAFMSGSPSPLIHGRRMSGVRGASTLQRTGTKTSEEAFPLLSLARGCSLVAPLLISSTIGMTSTS